MTTRESIEALAPRTGDARGVTIDGSTVAWDEAHDVVIVGFGAAGASAAIEARTAGADVLLVDRFDGGGASQLSAGVVYFGGGTRLQRESGWEDSVEEMYAYLKLETEDAVSD